MQLPANKSIRYLIITAFSILILAAVIISIPYINGLIRLSGVLPATKLPAPILQSNTSIEMALKQRRSIREYKNEGLTLQQVGQLLWAAQGITSNSGYRTAPSAGEIYPLEVYLISGNVADLSPGVYHYLPTEHAIEKIKEGDVRNELAMAALNQNGVKDGAIDIVITGSYQKTANKYGKLAERLVAMEAGHAAQNIYLQSVSLGLGMVAIGTFNDAQVKKALELVKSESPLYIIPVGKF